MSTSTRVDAPYFWDVSMHLRMVFLKKNTVVPGCKVNGYNGHPYMMDKILWSQIFSGFYNVNFPFYNGLWYNSNSDITDKNLVPNWHLPTYNSQIEKKFKFFFKKLRRKKRKIA